MLKAQNYLSHLFTRNFSQNSNKLDFVYTNKDPLNLSSLADIDS